MAYLDSLKPLIDSHPLLRHPVLERMRRGELSRDQLRIWATEQFYFSISLPSCFAALYARVPARYWQEKRPLVELIRAEAWGADEPDCHSLMFCELADFLDINTRKLTVASAAPFTRRFVDTRLNICSGESEFSDPAIGVALIALGNEYLNLHLFPSFKAAFTLNAEMTGCPLGYFDAHLHDEEADFRVFSNLYDCLPRTPGQKGKVKRALTFLLGERRLFFNGLAGVLRI